jgi:hypothetical protein
MKYEEFKLFIQSIGFIYERQMMGKEFYKLGKYDLELTNGYKGIYKITQKVQLGVTRYIITDVVSSVKDNLSVFISISREHKLNSIGI